MSASRDLDVERKSKLINKIRGFSLEVPKTPIEVFKRNKIQSTNTSVPFKEVNIEVIQKILLTDDC